MTISESSRGLGSAGKRAIGAQTDAAAGVPAHRDVRI